MSRTDDPNFRVTNLTAAGSSTSETYDADGRLTGAGTETLARDPQTGHVTGTTLQSVGTSLAYDPFGELTQLSAVDNGQSLFSAQYGCDSLDRVVSTTETIGGATSAYTYDLVGRLTEVDSSGASGTTVTTYGYDANGNRLSATGPAGTVTGSYDAQDRLIQYGSTAYSFDPNGNLQSKSTNGQSTSYVYDELGNLLQVTLPTGTTICYLVDGQGRRIAKERNGMIVADYLY